MTYLMSLCLRRYSGIELYRHDLLQEAVSWGLSFIMG